MKRGLIKGWGDLGKRRVQIAERSKGQDGKENWV